MAATENGIKLLAVLVIALAISSCVSMNSTPMRPIQQSIRVNGDLQPKQIKITEFGNYSENGISAFSSNYRQFAREIKKGEKTEEAKYWEPINWRGINNLPINTKKLKIALVIENPRFKTYRLIKITDIEGQKREEEILKFSSGGQESFADIQEMYDLECPVIVNKTIRVIVRLDLLEGSGIPGLKSLPVSELAYKIGEQKGTPAEKRLSQKTMGGDHPEN
jgi:hypothetical protein